MIKNTIAVYIDGINRTDKLLAANTASNILDETLDEGVLRLQHIRKQNFPPLTPVELRVTNALMRRGKVISTQTRAYYYLVAGDNAEESPNGSGLYNHELALVEVTKIAECIVVDTITVTNDIGRVYTNNQRQVDPTIDNEDNDYSWIGWDDY